MRSRVLERIARERVDPTGLKLFDEAITAALSVRDAQFADDHHVDLLHPARTALILIDDVLVTDPMLLSIAALLESYDTSRAVPSAQIKEMNAAAAAALRAIPTPGGDGDALLERLLALPAEHLTIALAERLDHARHLHLRPAEVQAAALHLESTVYLPLARRSGGLLGKRYERWHAATTARLRSSG